MKRITVHVLAHPIEFHHNHILHVFTIKVPTGSVKSLQPLKCWRPARVVGQFGNYSSLRNLSELNKRDVLRGVVGYITFLTSKNRKKKPRTSACEGDFLNKNKMTIFNARALCRVMPVMSSA